MSMTETDALTARFEGLLAAEDEPQEEAVTDEGSDIEEPEEDADQVEAEADDEAEAEAETDEEVEDEADEDESGGPAEFIEFEQDGQTVRLTPDEAKAGYLRQSDYTRKTQALSQREQALVEAQKTFETQRQQAIQDFNANVEALMGVLEEAEPDWEALAEEDPVGFNTKKLQWDKKQAKKQEALRKHHQQMESVQRQAAEQRAQYLQSQRQLLPDLIPDWKDQSKAQQQQAELAEALKADGFRPEDVDNIADARLVAWLLDAKRWRDFQKSKPAVVKKKTAGKPKVQKPGTTPKADPKKVANRKVRDVARKTGRPKDWAKVFEKHV